MSIEKSIPTQEQNPKGLHQRFYVEKLNGETDPKAEYFVLRLDNNGKDPNHINACRIGIQAYATAIEPFIPELAKDLKERYPAQQPVRKTLDEVKDEVARKHEAISELDLIGSLIMSRNPEAIQDYVSEVATLYAQAKAVEPQESRTGQHPEDYCHQCNRDNPRWYAPNEIFNLVTGTVGEGIMCPICFLEMAKAKGLDLIFTVEYREPQQEIATSQPMYFDNDDPLYRNANGFIHRAVKEIGWKGFVFQVLRYQKEVVKSNYQLLKSWK